MTAILAFADLIFAKKCQHRYAHNKFLLSRFKFSRMVPGFAKFKSHENYALYGMHCLIRHSCNYGLNIQVLLCRGRSHRNTVVCSFVCACVFAMCISATACKLQLSAEISNISRSRYFMKIKLNRFVIEGLVFSYSLICLARWPLYERSGLLQMWSALAAIRQLATP